jgi:hypothetical protein
MLAAMVLITGGYGVDRLVTGGSSGQPQTIAAALESFRSDRIPAEGPALRPAPDFARAGLELMHSGHGVVGGYSVDVYYYRGPAGVRLFLFESARSFPRVQSARDVSGPGHQWRAAEDGVSILCGDRPLPYLLIANRASAVTAAAGAIQLGTFVEA